MLNQVHIRYLVEVSKLRWVRRSCLNRCQYCAEHSAILWPSTVNLAVAGWGFCTPFVVL